MKSKITRDSSGAMSGLVGFLVAIALVGVVVLAGYSISSKGVSGPAALPVGGGVGGAAYVPPPPTLPPVAAAPTSVADMLAWNAKQSQGVSLASTFNDVTAGAAAANGPRLTFWNPGVVINGANALVLQSSNSGSDTTQTIKAGGYYQIAMTDSSNTYYSQALCNSGQYGPLENLPPATPTVNGMTACQVPVAYNPYVANPTWTFSANLRRVGAIVDPVDESATTDARNIQWANGQNNISNPIADANRGTRCLVSSTSAAGSQIRNDQSVGAATNGNVLFFNDTTCSGTFYIESLYECSATANRWCYLPVIHPKWSQNNGTGAEFSAVTVTLPYGNDFVPASPDATTNFNNQQPIPLGATPWIPSARINYHRITYTYTAANFAAGKCVTVNFDDQGGYLNGLINFTLTGSAAQSYQVCRAN